MNSDFSNSCMVYHHTANRSRALAAGMLLATLVSSVPAVATGLKVSASFNTDSASANLGKARFRSVNLTDANYERYRRDCAEYLSKYGTGKSCQFPQRGHRITIIQNNYHQHGYDGRYGTTYYPNRTRYGQGDHPVIVVNINRDQAAQRTTNARYARSIRYAEKYPQALPVGWAKDLRRGDILDSVLYERGRVTYRSPRGIVRIKLGNTTIQLRENTREIMSVINR